MKTLMDPFNISLDSGSLVAIKINLCFFRSFETGATTDPRILVALLKVLKDYQKGLRVKVFESDATATKADLLFRWLGIKDVCEKYEADVVNISKEPFVRRFVEKAGLLRNQKIPRLLDEADLFITLAKMKTHSLTKISCALKNQYGCILEKNKSKYHKCLDQVIVDVNCGMRSDISIVDGVIAMEGVNGPVYGKPRIFNKLLCSFDPVAVDAASAFLMGFTPHKIKHLKMAQKVGLGTLDFRFGEDFQIKRENFDFSWIEEVYIKLGNRIKSVF